MLDFFGLFLWLSCFVACTDKDINSTSLPVDFGGGAVRYLSFSRSSNSTVDILPVEAYVGEDSLGD